MPGTRPEPVAAARQADDPKTSIMQRLHAEYVSRVAAGKVGLEHGASVLLTEHGDFARFWKLRPITLEEFADR